MGKTLCFAICPPNGEKKGRRSALGEWDAQAPQLQRPELAAASAVMFNTRRTVAAGVRM